MRVLVTGRSGSCRCLAWWGGGGGGRPGKREERRRAQVWGSCIYRLLMLRMSGEVSGRPGVKGLEDQPENGLSSQPLTQT